MTTSVIHSICPPPPPPSKLFHHSEPCPHSTYTRYATSKSMPQEDANSDLQEASVSRSGGILTMQFARKRVTDDTSRDISLDQCVYLLHAWGRGVRNYASKQYFYHSIRRFVSSRKVCFPNSTLCPPGKNQKRCRLYGLWSLYM